MYRVKTILPSFAGCLCGAMLFVFITHDLAGQDVPRDKFVSVTDLASGIALDMAYYGDDNFVGAKIDGYERPVCLLTIPAAEALRNVQMELETFGLSLKVFDCYRPQRAVDHFVRWGSDVGDQVKKKQYYPDVDKTKVFDLGYVATRSGHSRGSTVDLTLISRGVADPEEIPDRVDDCRLGDKSDPRELDMGTAYDCFDPLSHTENTNLSYEARHNRLLLRAVMEKHGFDNYTKEWWHFTYRNEPHRKEYFNFPVAW